MFRPLHTLRLWAILAFLLVGGPEVRAQDSTPLAPPVKGSFGLDVRLRDELLHNARDFDTRLDGGPVSDSHYYRLRVRAWTKATLRWGPLVCARVTAEPIKFMDPYVTPAKTEVILDNAYLEIPRLPLVPARLRAGRLDLPLGEGLLLMDGGPGDGSRSYYENALVVDLDSRTLGLGEGSLTLMAIRNLMRDPFVLAGDPKRLLIEKDETAFGLHLSSQRFGTRSEALYIYKEETHGDAATGPPPDTRLHTLSYRLTGEIPWQVSIAAEGAYQFGTRHDWSTGEKLADQQATGLLGSATRSFMAPFLPSLTVGGLFLSGDDPRTSLHEGWNPLFSRWPMWSSLYIYTLISEQGRVAYWQNLASFHAAAGLQLSGAVGVTYTYRHLRAVHAMPAGSNPLFGTGLTRGGLHIWQVTARLSPRVALQCLVERLVPGDFYAQRRDDAYFLRWEVAVQK